MPVDFGNSVRFRHVNDTAEAMKQAFKEVAGKDGAATRTEVRNATQLPPSWRAYFLDQIDSMSLAKGTKLRVGTFHGWIDNAVGELYDVRTTKQRDMNGKVTATAMLRTNQSARGLWNVTNDFYMNLGLTAAKLKP